MKKFLSASILTVLFLVACGGAPALQAGDGVLVDWAGDSYSWHTAKLLAACGEGEEAGWKVDFEDKFYNGEDGEEAECFKEDRMVKDDTFDEGDVKEGDVVLAQWVDSFYKAEVKTISEGMYSVVFEDGIEDEVELDKLRAALAEPKDAKE